MEDQKILYQSQKQKYLAKLFSGRRHIDNDKVEIPVDNYTISYSINKKKRWEKGSFEKPLVALKMTKYRPIAARNIDTGEDVSKPNEKYINNDDSDVFYYYERWNPKPDMIKEKLSMSGSHCLRLTTKKRGENRRIRRSEKKEALAMAQTE